MQKLQLMCINLGMLSYLVHAGYILVTGNNKDFMFSSVTDSVKQKLWSK